MMEFIKKVFRYIRLVVLHLFYRYRPSLSLSENMVIIAPHPDDEVMGCAGLIQSLVKRGMPPHVILMTRGEGAHRGCCQTLEIDIKTVRSQLIHEAAEVLGLSESYIHTLNYPDEYISLDCVETERLKQLLKSFSPNALFIPHWGEKMPDHLHTADIIKELMKDTNVSIYEYCVWMWYYNIWDLDYKNAFIVKMTKAMHKRKLRAIDQYITPLAPCGKPWSGILPKVLLRAARWNKELYFKVR